MPRIARIWLPHLLVFYVPLVSLHFVLTGPHAWWLAPLWMLPMMLAFELDSRPLHERRQPEPGTPALPFDVLVYALAGLQLFLIWKLVALFSVQGIFSVDMVMVFLLVGGSSGFSIITAHELIHRRSRVDQTLGRLILCTVLYEHFYTEHLRGHHVRVGTEADPATARFGESYQGFFKRTVPAQLRSAWRLEKRRLGDAQMGLLDARMLHNRILHGLVVEWGLAFAILGFFGLPAFLAFLLQAYVAVRLLEAVNYFEHWGLARRGPRVRPTDSWDTHASWTYYGLVGLSRHADHHAYPARPYQNLRVFEEAPVLPAGYVGTIDIVMEKNAEFQRYAAAELGRRRLGPFLPDEGENAAPLGEEEIEEALARAQQAEQGPAKEPGPLALAWSGLPALPRRLLVFVALLLLATAGVQWETLGSEMGFAPRFLLNAWILGAFSVGIVALRKLGERLPSITLAWALAYSVILVLGFATDALLA